MPFPGSEGYKVIFIVFWELIRASVVVIFTVPEATGMVSDVLLFGVRAGDYLNILWCSALFFVAFV